MRKLRNRGVNLPPGSSQASRAKKLLRRSGYYTIINGYKDIFLQYPSKTGVEDIYKPDTTFDSIYSLYAFDRNMRSILLKYILIVETIVKSHISYHFSEKYKSDFNYLNINNFNPKKIDTTTRLITNICSVIQVDTSLKKGQIPHYLNKHKCLPLWVLMRKLNFGTVSYFYACMTDSVRKKVSDEILSDYKKEYNRKDFIFPDFEFQLEEILKFINLFRNVCAHEDRLFNVEYKNKKGNYPRIALLHLKHNLGFKSKLFDLVALLKLFLTKSEFQELVKQIVDEWAGLGKYLNIKTLNEVMIKSGFPKKWEDVLQE